MSLVQDGCRLMGPGRYSSLYIIRYKKYLCSSYTRSGTMDACLSVPSLNSMGNSRHTGENLNRIFEIADIIGTHSDQHKKRLLVSCIRRLFCLIN